MFWLRNSDFWEFSKTHREIDNFSSSKLFRMLGLCVLTFSGWGGGANDLESWPNQRRMTEAAVGGERDGPSTQPMPCGY